MLRSDWSIWTGATLICHGNGTHRDLKKIIDFDPYFVRDMTDLPKLKRDRDENFLNFKFGAIHRSVWNVDGLTRV